MGVIKQDKMLTSRQQINSNFRCGSDLMSAHKIAGQAVGMAYNHHGKKINIRYAEDACPVATEDGNIVLPVPPKNVTEWDVLAYKGWTNHEVAHILYSNFEMVKRAKRYGGQTCANALNALEDIRIEKQFSAHNPGAGDSFREYYKRVGDQVQKRIDESPSVADKIYCAGIAYASGVNIRLNPMLAAALEELKPFMDRIQDLVSAQIPASVAYDRCKDCYDIAIESYDHMKKWVQEQQEKKEEEKKEEEKDETDQDESFGEDIQFESEDDLGQELQDDRASNLPGDHSLAMEDFNEAYNPCFGDEYIACSKGEKNQGSIDPFLEDFGKKAAQLAAGPISVLRGMASTTVTLRGQEAGRIDRKRLADLCAGTTKRAFLQRNRTMAKSVALSLLVDCSGSMGRNKILLAKKAIFALAAVADRANVKFEILSYEGYTLTVNKSFNDQWKDARVRASVSDIRSGGGTPTASATQEAAFRLGQQNVDRHILITVTDGQPNNCRMLEELLPSLRKSGMEVLAFGIGYSVAPMYGEEWSTRVTDSSLAKELVDEFYRLLLQGFYSRGC